MRRFPGNWEDVRMLLTLTFAILILITAAFVLLVQPPRARTSCHEKRCASPTASPMTLQGVCVCLERPLP